MSNLYGVTGELTTLYKKTVQKKWEVQEDEGIEFALEIQKESVLDNLLKLEEVESIVDALWYMKSLSLDTQIYLATRILTKLFDLRGELLNPKFFLLFINTDCFQNKAFIEKLHSSITFNKTKSVNVAVARNLFLKIFNIENKQLNPKFVGRILKEMNRSFKKILLKKANEWLLSVFIEVSGDSFYELVLSEIKSRYILIEKNNRPSTVVSFPLILWNSLQRRISESFRYKEYICSFAYILDHIFKQYQHSPDLYQKKLNALLNSLNLSESDEEKSINDQARVIATDILIHQQLENSSVSHQNRIKVNLYVFWPENACLVNKNITSSCWSSIFSARQGAKKTANPKAPVVKLKQEINEVIKKGGDKNEHKKGFVCIEKMFKDTLQYLQTRLPNKSLDGTYAILSTLVSEFVLGKMQLSQLIQELCFLSMDKHSGYKKLSAILPDWEHSLLPETNG